MAFHNVLLPSDISEGAVGGPGFKTQIVKTDSGFEHRISRWSTPLHRYDISYGIRTHQQLALIKEFYMARLGAAYSFRFKDWTDYTSSDSETQITNLDQVCEKITGNTYQLRKTYESGEHVHYRKISLPVDGTVVVAVDGVSASPTIDYSTGILTFAESQGNSVVTAGFEFDVQVRFAESADDQLAMNIKEVGTKGIGSIELVEVLDTAVAEDGFFYGGSYDGQLTADLALSTRIARFYALTCDGNDRACILPTIADVNDWAAGGPYFFIKNDDPQNSIRILKQGTSLVTPDLLDAAWENYHIGTITRAEPEDDVYRLTFNGDGYTALLHFMTEGQIARDGGCFARLISGTLDAGDRFGFRSAVGDDRGVMADLSVVGSEWTQLSASTSDTDDSNNHLAFRSSNASVKVIEVKGVYAVNQEDLVFTLSPGEGCMVCLSIDYTLGTYEWRVM